MSLAGQGNFKKKRKLLKTKIVFETVEHTVFVRKAISEQYITIKQYITFKRNTFVLWINFRFHEY